MIILAMVQGATEFLPVSSSGHLILAREVFGIGDTNGAAFDAFLHLGTLLAVLWYYRQTWWELAQVSWRPRQAPFEQQQLLSLLAVATVPAAIVGWGLQEWAETWRSQAGVGAGLLFTAGLLAVSERLSRQGGGGQDKAFVVRWRQAVGVGLAQVLALLPGVSRSGTTIAAGQLLGLNRPTAVKFSFLLSAPIIAGAGLSTVSSVVGNGFSGTQLMVALVVAFGSGLLAIAGLTRLVERISLVPFAVYLAVVAVVVWVV